MVLSYRHDILTKYPIKWFDLPFLLLVIQVIHIWRFPKMGVPPVIIHLNRTSHYRPSFFGTPPFMETSILSPWHHDLGIPDPFFASLRGHGSRGRREMIARKMAGNREGEHTKGPCPELERYYQHQATSINIDWDQLLVGGLVAIFYCPINIGFLIIPIDELIFFRGVAQPPTRTSININHRLRSIKINQQYWVHRQVTGFKER